MLKLKRKFYGRVCNTGELVEIEDWRQVIDTTTMFNSETRTSALGDCPYCKTMDGREMRVLNAKYVDVEKFEGSFELHDKDTWLQMDVSHTAF